MKCYAVMKMLQEVALCAPSGREIQSGPIGQLAGYIPVYHTIEEAIEAAENGKYEIKILQANG